MPGCSRSSGSSSRTRRRTSSATNGKNYDPLTNEESLIYLVVVLLLGVTCYYYKYNQDQWNNDWMLNQTNTPPFEYSKIMSQPIGKLTCHLNYTDNCDVIGRPDQRGLFRCDFKHILTIDKIENHSKDADGIFDHRFIGYWKYESPGKSLLSVAMRLRNCKSYTCTAAVHLKINEIDNTADGFYITNLNVVGNMAGNCNT
tara:strand:- start:992 stop:1591 length:600 start_codon:yes stop_codon:yes gene_type:complete